MRRSKKLNQLLDKLGIDLNQSLSDKLEQLEELQMETLDRLDRVQEKGRIQQLQEMLKDIEKAIDLITNRMESGIMLDQYEEEKESFEDLKRKPQEKQSKVLDEVKPQVVQAEKTQEELYDEALAIMATPEYEKGIQLLTELGNEGYLYAQKYLAKIYSEGNRVAQDESIAIKWCEMAANQGDVDSQFDMGWRYNQGIGVEQNNEEAVKWYEKAANQGHVVGQYNMGVMYENGTGVIQSNEESAKW